MRILIVYATTEGHTRKVAERLALYAEARGHIVSSFNIDGFPGDLPLTIFDAVLVGASIHHGHHPRSVAHFVRRHADEMKTMHTGFFSICLSAGSERPEDRAEALDYVTDFFRRTGWETRDWASFAGALKYREYGFLKRFVLKTIAKQKGQDTDTSRNYEYTDWDAVNHFAKVFLEHASDELIRFQSEQMAGAPA